jgi:ABC-type glycerol-3-phosphate transport system substrate-binding protein
VNPIRPALRPNAMKLIATGAAALLLTATLAGCGGKEPAAKTRTTTPPTTPPTSAPATATVRGRLLAVGGPAPGDPRPMSGTVTFTGPDGSTTKTRVDKTGAYEIGLYPGRYTIQGSSPTFDGGAPCNTSPPTTTLTAGKTTTANVYCQMR